MILPQAINRFHFMFWMFQYLRLHIGIGWYSAIRLACIGYREFIEGERINFKHAAFDWSRPAAHEICDEYILRDG